MSNIIKDLQQADNILNEFEKLLKEMKPEPESLKNFVATCVKCNQRVKTLKHKCK